MSRSAFYREVNKSLDYLLRALFWYTTLKYSTVAIIQGVEQYYLNSEIKDSLIKMWHMWYMSCFDRYGLDNILRALFWFTTLIYSTLSRAWNNFIWIQRSRILWWPNRTILFDAHLILAILNGFWSSIIWSIHLKFSFTHNYSFDSSYHSTLIFSANGGPFLFIG